ncbi:MAG: prolyl oligopeptidase family serine peptidase [Planctomycetota bacterium]|nr:prolyl oligopeptidase family serine peptidase [Planctomycetota bacterium]
MASVAPVVLLALLAGAASAQGSAADYRRAAELPRKWSGANKRFDPQVRWLERGGVLWFAEGRGPSRRYVLVAEDGAVRRAATADELGVNDAPKRLEAKPGWGRSARGGRRAEVTFVNRLERTVRLFWVDTGGAPRQYGELAPGQRATHSTYVGHAWIADYSADDLVGSFVVEGGKAVAVFDDASREKITRKPRRARERAKPGPTLAVRDHDVWWTPASGEPRRLTEDGSAEDGYRLPRYQSPDGKRALGFRVAPGEEHPVHLIESSPRDGVQPRLHTRDYTKPGDRIDRPRPVLFDVAGGRQIPIDEAPFEDAWRIDRVRWAEDSSEVFVLYNRRGHQQLRLYAIDAETGAVRVVVDEQSDTFVDYSQKTWMQWVDGGRRLLWASERDGWNHLYLVDVATGAADQVTAGEWLVRKVERVDEERRQVWFTAYGIHPDQDPYHAHLARVDFDGSDLTVLTESDGSHEWQFSPDGQWFVARWSRADHPWVTELRRSADGTLVAELGRDDVQPMLDLGFRPPERFVAKGRDGVTDIHGVLITPSNFDPAKRYPVIEDIYAGPHDFFVPKRWGVGGRQRRLAELGFVVVRIDGMGTNWRSKAFHDVCWRDLKDSGFPDRIRWLRAAAETRPYLDLDRVGIFGGSAGGQSTLAGLLHHGDFYDVGVSDCGCHDNRMDKIWWNEAWMGWPVGDWYADSSNVTHAKKLQGKLLLTVGELDRNVDPASTMQVVDALIRADKDFDLVVVPGAGHGVGESPYLVRRRQDFFVRHLYGVEPRR